MTAITKISKILAQGLCGTRTGKKAGEDENRVIITLRADFYDRPLMHPNFSEMVSERTQVVVPLKPPELEQAIIAPAG